jgi:hypothetical protein
VYIVLGNIFQTTCNTRKMYISLTFMVGIKGCRKDTKELTFHQVPFSWGRRVRG